MTDNRPPPHDANPVDDGLIVATGKPAVSSVTAMPRRTSSGTDALDVQLAPAAALRVVEVAPAQQRDGGGCGAGCDITGPGYAGWAATKVFCRDRRRDCRASSPRWWGAPRRRIRGAGGSSWSAVAVARADRRTAVTLLDEGGADALSMRSLARRSRLVDGDPVPPTAWWRESWRR